jgi:hypothetical protein
MNIKTELIALGLLIKAACKELGIEYVPLVDKK